MLFIAVHQKSYKAILIDRMFRRHIQAIAVEQVANKGTVQIRSDPHVDQRPRAAR